MSFYRENFVDKLKSLINDYEVRKMGYMADRWEGGDSCSDPVLQYEQEKEIDKVFDKIIDYVKTYES